MPKVSIVLPTYKVEKYFRQCLESVINQTLQDIEIIPVDDGSPDNCGKIMDEYAAKDSRIKPIHQENGGYGKAVNAGIAAATGEYIGIVETDDWVDPHMFEKLYEKAKRLNADVCKCDFTYYYGQDKYAPCHNMEKICTNDEVFTIKEKPELFLYHVSIWSAIYKKEFLNAHNVRIIETKSASYQDMPFAASVYAAGANVCIVPEHLIYYRAEEGMNSSTIRTDGRLKIMPQMCKLAMDIFKENNCWDEVKEVAYKQFYNCSVGMFFQTDKQYKEAHYHELYNLFKDIKKDNIQYKYFKPKDIKVISQILKNDFKKIRNFLKFYEFKISLKKSRQKLISIRWNKKQKVIRLFGKEFIYG